MTPSEVLDKARAGGVMIATAESCTGGMIAAALTEVPGSSDVVDRGFVTYSNSAKTEMLGVPAALIAQYGAVSEEVARTMAEGARDASNAGASVAVTGIAGPGSSSDKPEGMVCFAVATEGACDVETVQFGALGRQTVRQKTVQHALKLLGSALG